MIESHPTFEETVISVMGMLCAQAHETAKSKGWWSSRDDIQRVLEDAGYGTEGRNLIESQLVALTHSELSEGVEGLRKNLQDDHLPEFLMIECELADALIRIFDHAAKYGYRLPEALVAKMAYNQGRPHLHGGKAF